MKKIKIMNELLANKIAAGEIIERPLSVIKELVENALDANATSIKIELIDSGLEKIIVSDNGFGMSLSDLQLCTKRHATSKLYTDEDLYRVATLGFRGEALPSIFAVSKLEILSSTDGNTAYHLIKTTDDDFQINEVSFNKGTSIIVNNLFYNTPVRFKHLSNLYYELSLVIKTINKLALVNPNISFELLNNEQQLFYTSGKNNIDEVIMKVYNLEIANNIIKSSASNEHFQFEIYFAKPQFTRSRRDNIMIALNGRSIKNYQIENAIVESYGKFIHTNQFPIVILDIKMNYELVDVNIHPTKQQVKISLIENLLNLIKETIYNELMTIEYISTPSCVNAEIEENSDDFKELFNKTLLNDETQVDACNPLHFNNVLNNEQDIYVKEESNISYLNVESEVGVKQINSSEQLEIFEDRTSQKKFVQNLPMLHYIGQFQKTYLLFENNEGLFLVDQHAAKERINYELIFEKFVNKKFEFQQLLLPINFELSLVEMDLLKDKLEEFKKFGLVVEEFGIDSLRVIQADSFLLRQKLIENDVLEIKEIIKSNVKSSFAKYYEKVSIMMACKKSVKANQEANEDEAYSLIEELNLTKQPYTCPHGRPIFVKLTNYEIEKMFKRVF